MRKFSLIKRRKAKPPDRARLGTWPGQRTAEKHAASWAESHPDSDPEVVAEHDRFAVYIIPTEERDHCADPH